VSGKRGSDLFSQGGGTMTGRMVRKKSKKEEKGRTEKRKKGEKREKGKRNREKHGPGGFLV